MPYEKQEWENGNPGTPLSGPRLEHIEDGVEHATQVAEGAVPNSPAGRQALAESLEVKATLGSEIATEGTPAREALNAAIAGSVAASTDPLAQAMLDQILGRTPEASWIHYGDSMTDPGSSGAWVEKLERLTGLDHYDGGVPGETSAQISARVLADSTRRDRRFTFGMGRNDVALATTPAAVRAAVRSSVNHLTRRKLGLVFDVSVWSGETITAGGASGEARAKVLATNAELEREFPTIYAEVYAWLQSDAARVAAGLGSWSAGDLTDIANGVTPRSLRLSLSADGSTRDGGHLNGYGGNAVYYRVATLLYDRGYIDTPPVLATTLAFHNFRGANGAPLGTTDDGGKTWATEGTATWSIKSNLAQVVGASGWNSAYITDTHTDINIAARFSHWSGAFGLCWGGNGTTGYRASALDASTYGIQKRSAVNTFTTIASGTGVTPANGQRLWVSRVGAEHRLYVDSKLVCTATDNDYAGTQIGVHKIGASTASFGPFEAWASIVAA